MAAANDGQTKTKRKYVPLAKKTTQALIKVADQYFSKYVRLRDCTKKGDSWSGTCITCNKSGVVAYMDNSKIRFVAGWDAGHFISRGIKILRFDEENVNLQCGMHCNRYLSGNIEKYKLALDLKYGDGTYRKLEDTAKETLYYKFTKDELLQVIADSQTQLEFMINQ